MLGARVSERVFCTFVGVGVSASCERVGPWCAVSKGSGATCLLGSPPPRRSGPPALRCVVRGGVPGGCHPSPGPQSPQPSHLELGVWGPGPGRGGAGRSRSTRKPAQAHASTRRRVQTPHAHTGPSVGLHAPRGRPGRRPPRCHVASESCRPCRGGHAQWRGDHEGLESGRGSRGLHGHPEHVRGPALVNWQPALGHGVSTRVCVCVVCAHTWV